ncbi:MAG: hypothetical protein ACRDRU_07660 [Pseudonocardiaceae bacterium]
MDHDHVLRQVGLRVPDPLFSTTIPADRQPPCPPPLPPGGQPDPQHSGDGAGPLRWARCPDGGRLHLLAPAEVVIAATRGHAQALCGRPLAAEGLTLAQGSAELCIACLAGITPHQQPTHPVADHPADPRPTTGGDDVSTTPGGS